MSAERQHESEILQGKSLFLLESDLINSILKPYFLDLGMTVDSYPTNGSMLTNIINALHQAPQGYVLIHFITGGVQAHYNRLSEAILQRYQFDPRIIVTHSPLGKGPQQYDQNFNALRQHGISTISRPIFYQEGYEDIVRDALLQLPRVARAQIGAV